MNTPTNLDRQSEHLRRARAMGYKRCLPWPDHRHQIQERLRILPNPLYPYPEIATYNGAGDTTTTANFTCKQPPSK